MEWLHWLITSRLVLGSLQSHVVLEIDHWLQHAGVSSWLVGWDGDCPFGVPCPTVSGSQLCVYCCQDDGVLGLLSKITWTAPSALSLM